MTWTSVRVDILLKECLETLAGEALAGFEIDLAADGEGHGAIVDESMLRHLITLLAVACARSWGPSGILHIRLGRSGRPSGSPDSWLGASADSWIGITFQPNGTSGKAARAEGDESRDSEAAQPYWEDLAQASSLARFLGGRLVAPQPEGGLGRIALYLPPAQIAIQGPAVPPERILVLDDNTETRWAMGEILRRAGFDVIEAASAGEAQRLGHESLPKVRLIIGDLLLPVPQGVTLLLETSSALGGAPVLLVTGRRLGEEVREWLSRMRIPWLGKPFNREQLLRHVRAILSGES